MLVATKLVKEEYDYYITLDEMRVLLKCLNVPKVKDHYKLITWFLILTGRRIGEVLPIQVQDFLGYKSFDFSKLNIRLEKTGKVITICIVEPLEAMIREYVLRHHECMPGGYFFPKVGYKAFERPFMRVEDYSAFFSKLRKRAAAYSPSLLERYPNGIHRVHPHTIRHFFEDYALDQSKSLLFVKELMGYSDLSTVLVYANRKRIREEIPKFYDTKIFNLSRKLDALTEGQENINKYMV